MSLWKCFPLVFKKKDQPMDKKSSYMKHTDPDFYKEAQQEKDAIDSMAATFNIDQYKEIIEKKMNVSDICYLTKGGFGSIYTATETKSKEEIKKNSPESTQVALKVEPAKFCSQKLHKIWYNRAKREVHLLRDLEHPHIVAFRDYLFLTPMGETVPHCLVIKTELLNRDVLEVTKVKPLTLSEMARMAAQVGEAVSWMHSKRIIHHDLKPANIMAHPIENLEPAYLQEALQKVCYKVIDFNLAKKYSKDPCLETFEYKFKGGSKYYKCCEKVSASQGCPYNPYLADAYAYGVTLLASLMDPIILYHTYEELESMPRVLQLYAGRQSNEDRQLFSGHFKGLHNLLAAESDRVHLNEALKMFEKN